MLHPQLNGLQAAKKEEKEQDAILYCITISLDLLFGYAAY